MARKGLSLGTKLILGTALLISAAVASSAWYSVSSLDNFARKTGELRSKDLEQANQREADLLTRNAAASAASLLATSDYTRLEETARQLAGESPNVIWIAVAEQSGAIVATTEKAPVKQGGRIENAMSATLAKAPAGEIERIPDPTEPSRLLLGSPVFLQDSSGGNVRVGTVYLAYDNSALARARDEAIAVGRERARDTAERQVLFAALLLAVGLLLGLWQAMRISRPLLALSEQARHIASGDFGRMVEVSRSDEVGQLGESFNRMSESLVYLVEEIGRKASIEREMEVARSIQGLMTPPPDAVTIGDLSVMGRCEMASACGGDWWSYRRLADDRLLLVVGDVTGHGMPSAMIAATARGAVESLSYLVQKSITPATVLQAIDSAIRDVGQRLLMTCFAMIIAPDGSVRYANAGHTFPYIVSTGRGANKSPLEVLPTRSNPLGSHRPQIAEGQYKLSPGDFIVLTSDGLTDRLSEEGSRFGDKRLRKALIDEAARGTNDVRALCERIVGDVTAFGGEQPVDDDITLVVVHYGGTETARRAVSDGAVA